MEYSGVVEETADVIYSLCGPAEDPSQPTLTNECFQYYVMKAVMSVEPEQVEDFPGHEDFSRDLFTQLEWLQDMNYITSM